MKAIGYTQSLPAVQQDALVDIELPQLCQSFRYH